MKSIFIVIAGSGLGGALRYLSQLMVQKYYPSVFPFGTFSVNIAGCFLIGVFFAMAAKGNILSVEARLFLITGLCGGFTTFSSFSMENINLLRSGHLLYFTLYTTGSFIFGLLATFGGMQIVKVL